MNWLINTARYLSRFRYGDNMDAFVHRNRDKVAVKGIETSLSKSSSMVHNLTEQATKLMCSLSFVQKHSELPEVPFDSMIENAGNTDPGFSTFSPQNPALQDKAQFIHDQLVRSAASNNGHPLLDLNNQRQIQEYCDKVQQFLNTLLALVHYTSGQPARGTELLSVHHENPLNGSLRNIFLYHGHVAVVPQYH
ncbi:hypothetical protein NX059_012157 [Plenodomus lindquistii]|nr:hypothetical protein NX059_012157 [Plenodomus lindquistii]